MSSKPTFDEKWLDEYYSKRGMTKPSPVNKTRLAENNPNAGTKRSKYGNEKTQRHGHVFDSKHEADVYDELSLLAISGEISGFACQVPFHLPGGIKYIADFVTMNRDGTYTVIDAKSEATKRDKTYRLKRRLMRECLGIEIQEK